MLTKITSIAFSFWELLLQPETSVYRYYIFYITSSQLGKNYKAHKYPHISKWALFANPRRQESPSCVPYIQKDKTRFLQRGRGVLYGGRQSCAWKDIAKYNLPSHLPFVSATGFIQSRSQLQRSLNQIDSWQSVMFPHFTLQTGSLGTSNVKCTIQTPLNI